MTYVTNDYETFDIPYLELLGGNNSGRSETGEFRADFDSWRYVPTGKLNFEVSSIGNNFGQESVSSRLRFLFSNSSEFAGRLKFGFDWTHWNKISNDHGKILLKYTIMAESERSWLNVYDHWRNVYDHVTWFMCIKCI